MKKAVREVGIGAISALGILALFARGTTGAVEVGYIVLAGGVLWWMSTVTVRRLVNTGGRPQPFVFGSLGGLIAIGAVSLSVFAEPLVLVAVAVLVLAAIVGLWRVFAGAAS